MITNAALTLFGSRAISAIMKLGCVFASLPPDRHAELDSTSASRFQQDKTSCLPYSSTIVQAETAQTFHGRQQNMPPMTTCIYLQSSCEPNLSMYES